MSSIYSKPNGPSYKSSRSKGFSLSELIVALAIFSLVVGGILSFHIQMVKGGLLSEQKNRINRDIRAITIELNDIAKASNYFVLYNSYALQDRRQRSDRLFSDKAGDFVVFVFTDPDSIVLGGQPITRLVGYFRRNLDFGDVSNVGPIIKFDITYNEPIDIGSAGSTKLEDLFPESSEGEFDEVVELTKGLANGKLFYNFDNKSVMVNGQIYHGKSGNRVTDTYNFSISPRG